MENNKFDVLTYVIKERSTPPEYPDEAIFSNLYYTSLSTELRAIAGYREEQKRKRQNDNEWIKEESSKACDIRVINLDGLVSLLKNGKASCDAFFYNFEHEDGEFHFIAEFKRVNKQKLLELLSLAYNHKDSIY